MMALFKSISMTVLFVSLWLIIHVTINRIPTLGTRKNQTLQLAVSTLDP